MTETRYATIFARGLYPLGTALVLFPLSDIASKLIPIQGNNLQWRFASMGMVASSLALLLIGDAVLGFTAALRDNRLLLRLLAAFSHLFALALIAGLVLFVLDFIQLRAALTNPAMELSLRRAAVAALIAGLLTSIALVGVGAAAWAASGRHARYSESPVSRSNPAHPPTTDRVKA